MCVNDECLNSGYWLIVSQITIIRTWKIFLDIKIDGLQKN
jgi:hypothetical protein